MRETMAYYRIRDFATIRINCHHNDCRVVTEVAVQRVEALMKKTGCCCPACGKPFTKPDVEGGADIVTQIAKAVLALNSLAPQVGLEFPIVQNESIRETQ